MKKPMYFPDDKAFEAWLKDQNETADGVHIYMYKKGHEKEGLTYEAAVRTALCYGWIDAVTHSCDETRFIQYFAPRRSGSNWSLSNMIRVRELIKEGRMTESGLHYFDISWLDTLDERIEEEKRAKETPVALPEYFKEILMENDALELFRDKSYSTQRMYVDHTESAKKSETKERRCRKIAEMLKSEKERT